MRLRSAGGPSRQKPASLAMCADAPHYQTLIKATQEREREREAYPVSKLLFPHSWLFFPHDTPSTTTLFPSLTLLSILCNYLCKYLLFLVYSFLHLLCYFLPASLHCLHFCLHSLLLSLAQSSSPHSTSLLPPLILSRCCAVAPRGSQRWEMY